MIISERKNKILPMRKNKKKTIDNVFLFSTFADIR